MIDIAHDFERIPVPFDPVTGKCTHQVPDYSHVDRPRISQKRYVL